MHVRLTATAGIRDFRFIGMKNMKVLVVKTSSMGDVIHTLPALTDAAKQFPQIRFHWLVEEAFADIPAMHFQVERVIPIAWRRWRKQLWSTLQAGKLKQFWQELRAENYDYIIDAQGLLKSAIFGKLARGVLCGADSSSIREPLAAFLYQRCYPISAIKSQHAITRTRELFATVLGYPLPTTPADYGLALSNLPERRLNETILFITGTARDYKLWPEEYWISLAKNLAAYGFSVQLPWGNEVEKHRAERIAAACQNAVVLPKQGLRDLALLLLQVRAAVAVDTGLGHLAAALNVPSVSLYGPTDPALIGASGGAQVHLSVNSQMSDLKPECVWEELKTLLEKEGRRQRR
jgi:heptosyltransferase-1